MAAGRKFALNEPVDVLVVGTGAGGGNIIRELCLNGVSVVALEAGPRYDPERDFENDEWTMFNRLSSPDVVVPAGEDTHAFPVWTCKTVGGSTVHWTGASLRPRASEFRSLSVYGPIDGTSLADWPVDLEEMLPWYEKAERYLGVTGRAQPSQIPNTNYLTIKRGADELGIGIRPNHIATNPFGSYDGRSICSQRGHCMQGCSNGAMWSSLNEAIPKAEKTGWLELRTECQAVSVNLDKTGRARSVTYARADGTLEEQQATTIVIAGNAIQTARLLLHSASAQAPHGVANGSGLVGKNFMHHVTGTTFAKMPHPVHAYKGITVTGLIDHYGDSRPGERGFVGGFNLLTVFMGVAAMSIFAKPTPVIGAAGSRGNWGDELVDLMNSYDHLAGLHFIGEDMPREENRVTLHPTQADRFGVPVPVLSYTDHENNRRMRRFAWDRAADIWKAAGALASYEVPPFPDTHLLGTCRMGDDPQTSVVNRWGQAHEVSNLFIADGSVFPTPTAQNPTLTISALAIRQAQHIMDRMAALDL